MTFARNFVQKSAGSYIGGLESYTGRAEERGCGTVKLGGSDEAPL